MLRLPQTIQAVAELGFKQSVLYALYQLGLKSGHYKRLTPVRHGNIGATRPDWSLRTDLIPLPDHHTLQEITHEVRLLSEADEILSGRVRLFGAHPVPIELTMQGPSTHWSEIPIDGQDLKPIWETGRFGWAIILARAYYISKNEDYAQSFWKYTETFLEANPTNQGPHWNSAQEVALRLIALVFAIQVFSQSPHSTPSRMSLLAVAIADHASRIPPTLIYARAQSNNHLISEAAGLYTAAVAIPSHPKAVYWKRLGWKWLNHALQQQIAPDGSYCQHSTNYHRLMLQVVLWIFALQQNFHPRELFPPTTLQRLAAATQWINSLLDPISGGTPNLGPNDGAYVLPLSTCPFDDYRPVIGSAGVAFLQERLVLTGVWDEMACWLGLDKLPLQSKQSGSTYDRQDIPPHTLHSGESWAYLRVAQFHSRPGHADQLHLDLWWRGLNIAQDPGTFLYTASYPWDNALTHTAVHNTIMLNGVEQMRRAGRFLYLDWAQAQEPVYQSADDGSWQRISSQHNGYKRQKLIHQRSVTVDNLDNWIVSDILSGPSDGKIHQARIQWLLPDWNYEIETNPDSPIILRLGTPHGWISLKVGWTNPPTQPPPQATEWGLARAGQLIAGKGSVHPTWGWTSPTYSDKIPALAFFVTVSSSLPIHIQSQWSFPQIINHKTL